MNSKFSLHNAAGSDFCYEGEKWCVGDFDGDARVDTVDLMHLLEISGWSGETKDNTEDSMM